MPVLKNNDLPAIVAFPAFESSNKLYFQKS